MQHYACHKLKAYIYCTCTWIHQPELFRSTCISIQTSRLRLTWTSQAQVTPILYQELVYRCSRPCRHTPWRHLHARRDTRQLMQLGSFVEIGTASFPGAGNWQILHLPATCSTFQCHQGPALEARASVHSLGGEYSTWHRLPSQCKAESVLWQVCALAHSLVQLPVLCLCKRYVWAQAACNNTAYITYLYCS